MSEAHWPNKNENEREHGRVKFVNDVRGVFFIVPDNPLPVLNGRDVFGHISACELRADAQ